MTGRGDRQVLLTVVDKVSDFLRLLILLRDGGRRHNREVVQDLGLDVTLDFHFLWVRKRSKIRVRTYKRAE